LSRLVANPVTGAIIRLVISLSANGAAFLFLARLLPFIVLQAGKSAPRLGLFLLLAAIGATAAAWAASRRREGTTARTLGLRWAVAFGGELVVLVLLMLVGPMFGVKFGIGGLPGSITPAGLAGIAVLGAVLAAVAVAADVVGRAATKFLSTAAGNADPTRTAILAIFLLSGAAGLMYEIVWSRQLVLVFGNTTQAVSAILTGFFGGMAIGSVIGGRLADRVRRPLRLYGFLELALVVVVLITPLLFRGLHELYRTGYDSLESQPTALALLRYVLALLALAPATVMMGATLPTLSRHLSRRREELGTSFGRLYAVNTVGAIVGTALAGLVLIEIVGLTGTLVIGAVGSGTAGLTALLIDRRTSATQAVEMADAAAAASLTPDDASPLPAPSTPTVLGSAEASNPAPTPTSSDPSALADRWPSRSLPLIVAFVSGLTSLGYQVLWTRLLASGSGNTTYVFTAILTVFLIGIATGAAFVARRLGREQGWLGRATIGRLGVVQLLVAAIVLSGLVILSGQFPNLPFAVRVVLVVLPATLAIGLTLPLASSLVSGADDEIGRDAGLLLGVNTLGSIGGTFIVPFFLIPLIGSPASLVVLALVNIALGLGLVGLSADLATPARRVAASAGSVLVALAIIGLVVPNSLVANPSANALARDRILLADKEDEIASVQAGGRPNALRLLVGGTGMTRLTVDAKVMTYLPLITRPDARRLLVICFGMGSSYRAGLIAGLETDGVELVPSVINMFGYFYPDAPQVLADARGHVITTDGRNYVELTDKTYDIIVVDPPPPIESSGTSVLYSREFYEAASKRLTPDGVMMEWIPYDQSVDEFRSHVQTFTSVFPEVMMAFGPTHRGVYMLGSQQPISVDNANVQSVLARPGVAEDLIDTPDNPKEARSADAWANILENVKWVGDDGARAFAGNAPVILDDRPGTEYFLLRRLFSPHSPPMNEENLLKATPRD
jgi:spermidine synthase